MYQTNNFGKSFKKKLFIILLIFVNGILFTQNKTVLKKLEIQLLKHDKNDTTKINTLNAIANEYLFTDAIKTIINTKEALKISEEINYEKGIAQSNVTLGFIYLNQGDYKRAIKNLILAQNIYIKLKDDRSLGKVLLYKGLMYRDLKEFQKALELFHESLELYQKFNLLDNVTSVCVQIGITLIEKEEKSQEALEHLIIALKKNKIEISEVHYGLSLFYLKKNNLRKAFHHIKKAIKISEKNNNIFSITKNILLLGKIQKYKGDLIEAENNLKKGLKYARDNYLKKQELFAYDNLKMLKNKQPEVLIEFYNEYIKLNELLFNYNTLKEIASIEQKNDELIKSEFSLNESKYIKEKNEISIVFWIPVFLIVLIITFLIKKTFNRKSGFKVVNDAKNEDLASIKLLKKNKKLKEKLKFNNKQLTSYWFNFQQKDEIIKSACSIARSLEKSNSSQEEKRLIQELIKIGKENFSLDKEWERFRTFFEEAQSGFHTKLKLKHSNLKTNDLKLCSLIRLNLNIKETASILNISGGSLKTARYRLRKKLNLESGQDIVDYLIKIEMEEFD